MDNRKHVQQKELITEQKLMELRKLLEIQSSSDSRIGNFCYGERIVEKKAWSKAAACRNRVRSRGYNSLSRRVSSPKSCSYVSQ